MITPWVSVQPDLVPAAILGDLPMAPGTVSYRLPSEVVPSDAGGILVFAWCALAGVNPASGHWHMGVNVDPWTQNWFALLGIGSSSGGGGTAWSSQAFWLPMAFDGLLRVTLTGGPFPSTANAGQVEIHGYMPPSA